GSPTEDDNRTIASNFDLDSGLRHVGTKNGVGGTAYIVTACESEPTTATEFSLAEGPLRALNDLSETLRQAVALDAQAIHGDGGRLQKVSRAKNGWIDAKLYGDFVERTFEGEPNVDGAVSAHGSAGRFVGKNAEAIETNMLEVVDGVEQGPGVEHGHRAIRTISATVLNNFAKNTGDATFARGTNLQVDDGAWPSPMSPENFFASVSDFDGSFRFASSNGGDDFQRINFALTAKAATDEGFDDADLRHREAQDERQFVLEVIRNLSGGPYGEATGVAGLRIDFERSKGRVRLHRGVRNFIGDVARFVHDFGGSDRAVGITEDVVILLFNVVRLVGMNKFAGGEHRLLGIKVGGQDFVIDLDEFESTVGGFFVDSHNAGDVVADVANFTCGERGLIVPDGKNAVRGRTVVAGNDSNNSVQSLSLAAIDAKDASVRVGGMENPADEHTRNGEIVGITARTGRFLRCVYKTYGLANDRVVAHSAVTDLDSSFSADLTASYICVYPVHRQRLPLMARLISSSVGSGLFSSNTLSVIMKPGVQ